MTLWKAVELKLAKMIGGERVPITGRQRGSSPDIRHPYLSIEVKERQKLPDWIHEAMEQAEMAKCDGEHPITILHEKGQKHTDDFVVMRLGEFITWVQGLEVENKLLKDDLRIYGIGET